MLQADKKFHGKSRRKMRVCELAIECTGLYPVATQCYLALPTLQCYQEVKGKDGGGTMKNAIDLRIASGESPSSERV